MPKTPNSLAFGRSQTCQFAQAVSFVASSGNCQTKCRSLPSCNCLIRIGSFQGREAVVILRWLRLWPSDVLLSRSSFVRSRWESMHRERRTFASAEVMDAQPSRSLGIFVCWRRCLSQTSPHSTMPIRQRAPSKIIVCPPCIWQTPECQTLCWS